MESIRRLLYLWLLMPLIGLLTITAVLGYPVVLYPVTEALDWALMDSARSLARLINTSEGYGALKISPADDTLLRRDYYDRIYYSVHADDGTLLAGDAKVVSPPPSLGGSEDMYYDSSIDGEPVRVAAMRIHGGQAPLIVQVAETTIKRTRLARQITTGVILVEVILIAIVGILVAVGIKKGLAPLQRLRGELEARSERDLRPIPVSHAPVEAQPLVSAINRLLEQLGAALTTQQQFVANAAHQLRTPLAGLRMQLEYALVQKDPQEWRRTLEVLTPVSERTVRLVHQLLTLARTEVTPRRTATMAATDLATIVRDVAGQCMPKAITRDIDLGLELNPAEVLGDALLLGELVTNLLDNALTYGEHGSRVTVRSMCRHGCSVLEVEDEGPGIPQVEREKIFARFYRTIGSPGDGCGLGLAIVQEIAQLHHARVEIQDPRGHRGTSVVVTFEHDTEYLAATAM